MFGRLELVADLVGPETLETGQRLVELVEVVRAGVAKVPLPDDDWNDDPDPPRYTD